MNKPWSLKLSVSGLGGGDTDIHRIPIWHGKGDENDMHRDWAPREGAISPAQGMSRRGLLLEGDTARSETWEISRS